MEKNANLQFSNTKSWRLCEIGQHPTYLCTASNLHTNTTTETFKHVIWGNIWQLPPEQNTTDTSARPTCVHCTQLSWRLSL